MPMVNSKHAKSKEDESPDDLQSLGEDGTHTNKRLCELTTQWMVESKNIRKAQKTLREANAKVTKIEADICKFMVELGCTFVKTHNEITVKLKSTVDIA